MNKSYKHKINNQALYSYIETSLLQQNSIRYEINLNEISIAL